MRNREGYTLNADVDVTEIIDLEYNILTTAMDIYIMGVVQTSPSLESDYLWQRIISRDKFAMDKLTRNMSILNNINETLLPMIDEYIRIYPGKVDTSALEDFINELKESINDLIAEVLIHKWDRESLANEVFNEKADYFKAVLADFLTTLPAIIDLMPLVVPMVQGKHIVDETPVDDIVDESKPDLFDEGNDVLHEYVNTEGSENA